MDILPTGQDNDIYDDLLVKILNDTEDIYQQNQHSTINIDGLKQITENK